MNRQKTLSTSVSCLVCGDAPHSTITTVTCIFPLNWNCGADSWGDVYWLWCHKMEKKTEPKKSSCVKNQWMPNPTFGPQALNQPIYIREMENVKQQTIWNKSCFKSSCAYKVSYRPKINIKQMFLICPVCIVMRQWFQGKLQMLYIGRWTQKNFYNCLSKAHLKNWVVNSNMIKKKSNFKVIIMRWKVKIIR